MPAGGGARAQSFLFLRCRAGPLPGEGGRSCGGGLPSPTHPQAATRHTPKHTCVASLTRCHAQSQSHTRTLRAHTFLGQLTTQSQRRARARTRTRTHTTSGTRSVTSTIPLSQAHMRAPRARTRSPAPPAPRPRCLVTGGHAHWVFRLSQTPEDPPGSRIPVPASPAPRPGQYLPEVNIAEASAAVRRRHRAAHGLRSRAARCSQPGRPKRANAGASRPPTRPPAPETALLCRETVPPGTLCL